MIADAPAVAAARPPAAAGELAGGTAGYLAGDWDVLREIADHRAGRSGQFRGTAAFRPAPGSPGVLELTEDGELRFGAHRGPASRRLRYAARPDGAADVRFADGRAFFRLDLGPGSCQAVHPCGEDRYAVTVTRLSADCFTEIWRVTGPGKDYDMTTVYTRAGQA